MAITQPFSDSKQFKAVAAMSLNRVIGAGGKIPWHLPEDFRWFKKLTTGHVVVMGRKTFESLGKPLPNRTNVIVTRSGEIPGVIVVRDLAALDPSRFEQDVFIIGGAEIYAQTLPRCSDLFLTVVKREVDGDTFFPEFESMFELKETILSTPEFDMRHYVRR